MKRSTLLSRRRFLQGTGVTLALPFLESAAAPTTRGGTNSNGTARRLLCIGNHLGYYPPNFFPNEAGRHYATPATLKPLESQRDKFTIFSHLDHGVSGGHKGVHAFLSGVRKEEAAGFPEKNLSLDQAAAEFTGSNTRYPSITAGLSEGTDMCWTRSGVRIPPINNPARLFEALFIESDPTARRSERVRLRHRASVLDAVLESAHRLERRLASPDRDKLDQYLTSVREVEKRLQMSQEWLDRPKPKAPLDPVLDEERQHIAEIPLFYDLLTLALQTDSTRVATFEVPINFRTAELAVGSYHGLSHHSKAEQRLKELAIVETYLMKQLSHLITRLEEAGILNETLVVFGSGMSDGSRHSNKDLPVLLAGGGVPHQGHLICPEEDRKRIPLGNLWLSTLQWFGLEIDRFNKSNGTFSPMKLT